MKKGVKALKRVATVGLAFALTGYETSETLSQSTAGQKQDVKTEAARGDADTVDLLTLRVAIIPFITSLPTEYIRKNELDEKAGFRMDTTMFATGTPMDEALAAGLWDAGAMGATAVTGMTDYNMMIIDEVLESTDGLGIFIKPDSPIAQVKDYDPSYPNALGDLETVKGVTIPLSIGTAQHFTTLKQLERLGLDIMDVNTVNVDTAQACQVLQANRYGTVALDVPTFFEAVDDDMVQVGNLADLGTRHVDTVVANRKAVEGKQELVQKYIGYVKEACEAFSDDPDMAADLMVNFLKDAGVEASRENRVSGSGRVYFVTAEDWRGREMGDFARELGEFYISLGQLEPGLIGKSNSSIVSDFMKSGN